MGFVQTSRAPNDLGALRLLLQHTSTTTDAELSNVAAFAKLIGSVAEDAYMTATEKLTQQAEEKGRKEGRTEGLTELSLRQLAVWFGTFRADVAERVDVLLLYKTSISS